MESQRVQVSRNVYKQLTAEYKVGVTAIDLFGNSIFKISKQRCDRQKLGRWLYITLKGKNDITTTIITYYFLCQGTSSEYVYVQHLLYMSEHESEIP